MNVSQPQAAYLATQVPEITTLTAAADVSGSTTGLYTITYNALGQRVIYYNVVGGSAGDNIVLGVKNIATVIAVADVSGSLAGTYFTAGAAKCANGEYFYNIVTDNSYDSYLDWHLVANQKYYNVTLPADTSGNYTGTYFLFYNGAGTKYYVWYYNGVSGVNPAPSGATLAGQINYTNNATAATLATLTAAAINATVPSQFYAVANVAGSGIVSIINIADGTLTIPTIGTIPTGWAVAAYTPVLNNKSYDPRLGRRASYNVTAVADVSGSLAGTYFKLYDGANNQYYVWYSTGASTNPSPGGTGIQVLYSANASAATIAALTVAAINAYVLSGSGTSAISPFWAKYDYAAIGGTNTNQILISCLQSTAVPTAWAAGTSGFTVTANVAGVAYISGLAAYNPGIPVTFAVNSTAITVAAAIATAANAYIDPTTGIGDYSVTTGGTSTATFKGNTQGAITSPSTFGAATSGFTVTITQAGANPLPTDIYIPVQYAQNATAAQIQAAYIAANQSQIQVLTDWPFQTTGPVQGALPGSGMTGNLMDARVVSDQIISGSAPSIIITNRRGGVAGTASTTTTGWTIARTQAGTTTLGTNAGANAGYAPGTPGRFQYIPLPNEVFNVAQLNFLLGTLTSPTIQIVGFANISALTNGIIVATRNVAGAIVKVHALVFTNGDLALLGASSGSSGMTNVTNGNTTTSAFVAATNFEDTFGGKLTLNGAAGEYLEITMQDATTGSGQLNFGVSGASVIGYGPSGFAQLP